MEPMTPEMVNALTSFFIASALFAMLLVGWELIKWRERKKRKVEKL